ncbi:MAG: NAD(P)-binding domain-containing protein [Chthoniobacterales bacterium]
MRSKKVAIIGAGPIGLEAGLTALERGYDFTIYERGRVAEAVRQWGHVRMFSAFKLNMSERGVARLGAAGIALPSLETMPTGAEFRAQYLVPLANTMASRLRENCEVRGIGRSRRLKGDFISDPERGAAPFRLLVRDDEGERNEHADIVLDCSGTFAQANVLGEGGIPVPGESAAAERIHYGLPDVLGERRECFAGRRVLVVGRGLSAATAIRDLATLPETEITWLIRRDLSAPIDEIPDDFFPARLRLSAHANNLVCEGRVQLLTRASIDSVSLGPDGIAMHSSNSEGEEKSLTVDEIIASTGFRPDLALTRELQVQTCWATEGTYPLAASLLGETGADCSTVTTFGAESLLHPEPGYFTLGIKSYGRAPNFHLRIGYEQVASVFDWLAQRDEAQVT